MTSRTISIGNSGASAANHLAPWKTRHQVASVFGLALSETVETAYKWLHEFEGMLNETESAAQALDVEEKLVLQLTRVIQLQHRGVKFEPRTLPVLCDLPCTRLSCLDDAIKAIKKVLSSWRIPLQQILSIFSNCTMLTSVNLW